MDNFIRKKNRNFFPFRCLFILLLSVLGLRASAQQISLIVDHRVVNDTLFLDFEVANSGIPSLNFSTADFIIALQ